MSDYRPDIDGLRAIAVLSVISFHAFPTWLEGGFVGVDVFFVISGYLISRIILTSLHTGQFSILGFYQRRVLRIVPALTVVLIAVFAVGIALLLPSDLRDLGAHTLGGAGFFSNLLLWRETGYFDTSSSAKPLLHLWSLGVEEQFYLLWPVLLWTAYKRRGGVVALLAAVGLGSFVLSVMTLESNPAAAFYSPAARFWELLAGAALAQSSSKSNAGRIQRWQRIVSADMLSTLGGLTLALSIFFTSELHGFPGWWAIPPVVAAFLLIAAGPVAWLNRMVLSQPLLVWIGRISFPLYLWHWPLLAFPHILGGASASMTTRVAAVAASFVLAWLTFAFIERPVRSARRLSQPRLAGFLLAPLILAGMGGFLALQTEGLGQRPWIQYWARFDKSIAMSPQAKDCFDLPSAHTAETWMCTWGKSGPVSTFVIGDSHALSVLPALEALSTENRERIAFAGASGCPHLLGIQSVRDKEGAVDCLLLNERAFDYVVKNGIPAVFLFARWTYYTGGKTRPWDLNFLSTNMRLPNSKAMSRESFVVGLSQTVERYKRAGVKIFIFKDVPQQLVDPKKVLRRLRYNTDSINDAAVPTDTHLADQQWVNAQIDREAMNGAEVLSFNDLLCNAAVCPLVDREMFRYFDDDHLSVHGAMLVLPRIRQALQADSLTAHHAKLKPVKDSLAIRSLPAPSQIDAANSPVRSGRPRSIMESVDQLPN